MKSTVGSLLAIVLGTSFVFAQLPGVSSQDQQQIENQISSLYGDIFEVSDILNVDSTKGKPWITEKNYYVEDPYGTLAQCFVFLAKGRPQEDMPKAKGFIGVFKQGQIIWHSDTLIDNEFVVAAELFAIKDLNRDGTVDLVTSWFEGNRGDIRNIWIFSWDGQSGRLITDLDEKNQSVIISVADDLELTDINGDGMLEIQGKWHNNVDQSLQEPVTYWWNGQLYGKWSNPPQPPPDGFLPKDKADVNIRSKVAQSGDRFVFRYVVENKPASFQKLENFAVVRATEAISSGIARSDWRFDLWKGEPALAGWIDLFRTNLMPPGVKDSSFGFETSALPTIARYYSQGNNGTPSLADLFTNSVHGTTLGPADPPNPFVPLDFIDTIASYKQQASALGWIDNQGIANSLDQKLENARAQLEKKNNKSAKNILQAFINEVEAQKDEHLSSEAYALLKFNAEYLISKL